MLMEKKTSSNLSPCTSPRRAVIKELTFFNRDKAFLMTTISPKDVSKVARLSRLTFDDMESEKLRQSLSGNLNWFEQLNEVNVEGVDPLNSVFVETMPKREDIVTDGDQPKALTSNAPEADFDMFCVPKVVE